MSLGIRRPWQPLTLERAHRLPGQLGVYELADGAGEVILIGYAGGRSRFGLRGELEQRFKERRGEETLFRYEVNMQYLSRYDELLMVFCAEHGRLPKGNRDRAGRLGRLQPRG